jgi:hypothetical protein
MFMVVRVGKAMLERNGANHLVVQVIEIDRKDVIAPCFDLV